MSQVPDRFASLPPLKRAVLALQEVQAKLDAVERGRREPIAIVGVGCRIPGGVTDTDSFWRLLENGVCAVRETPADRWNVDTLYDPNPDAPGRICTTRGSYLDEVDRFDAAFFGIAPREAATMDPQQRLFLEVAWEALEHAGIAADRLSGTRTGVFVGIATSDYVEVLRESDQSRIDAYHASGIAHSIASGRLSYILGLQGPSISIDTACSSSLVAVHLAVQSLRSGESRMALAGGVNLILTPTNGIIFSKSHMLAADGRCKTFDAAADGFGRGEGCGVVVLKRLSDAIADGDRVLAVIRGSAANQDGPSSGLTAPNGPAQEAVIREALANGSVRPAEVGYVEAHGTGTSLGDPIEVQALGAVLREGRDPGRPVVVGSLKTNVGHLEAAAGVAGLIKVVLSLQHEAIPPHLHLERLNPHVAWEELPVTVPTALTEWKRGADPRIAGISSFGFSGTNVHLVIEEAPATVVRSASRPSSRPSLVTVSARTEAALVAKAGQLAQYLSTAADVDIADAAHTANVGRAHLPVRAAVLGSSREEIVSALRGLKPQAAADMTGMPRLKVAFLFTGQGAQYPGMGRDLYESQPVFREAMDRCDAILQPLLETPLLSVIYGERTALLDQTAYTQPALFAVEYALAALWRSWGIEPAVVLGHSIGEYVAACMAGAMTLEDALGLVAERGRLMQSLPAGGAMAAIFTDEPRVQAAIARRPAVSLAAINGPSSVVVSGSAAEVAAIVAEFAAAGIKSKPLNVSHAFHSPLMDPILDAFEAAAAKVRFSAPRIKVISNLTGRVASAAELSSPRYWRDHLRGTVRFADGIRVLAETGVRAVVEAGPQPTLIGMGMQCVTGATLAWVPSLRQGRDDSMQILEGVAALYTRNAEINWTALESGTQARPVTLPTYPFERERFWLEAAPKAPAAVSSPEDRHPIITRELSSPALSGRVLEGRISKEIHGYLYDHVVHDTPILPATAFLELALAAAREFGDAGCRLADVSIREALVLPAVGELPVQIHVTDGPQGTRTFRIYSAAQRTAWTLHVEGTFVSAPVQQPVERMPDVAHGAAITPTTFYTRLSERGLEFGPAFQTVTSLHAQDGRATGTVGLPQPLRKDEGRFVAHPVLLDGAVQVLAGALTSDANPAESYLPVHLEAMEVSDGIGADVRATASIVRRSNDVIVADITLLDAESGRQVGRFCGLTLKRAHSGSLRRRKQTSDWLYSIEWEPATRSGSDAIVEAADLLPSIEAATDRSKFSEGFAAYETLLPALDDISAAYIAEAFRTLGLPMTVGARFTADDILQNGARAAFGPLVVRMIEILAERAIVRDDASGVVVIRDAGADDARLAIDQLRASDPSCGAELELLARCGPSLGDVLTGAVNPLTLLFPNGSSEAAERLYQESPPAKFYNGLVQAALAAAVDRLPADRPIRVLEIGGGTASTTGFATQVLPLERTEYTFSDISPLFVARAAERFAAVPAFRAMPLDIERDPSSQGFTTQGYDLVVAANVLHATADLSVTFDHVKRLLAPGGLMVLLEVTRKLAWIDVTFGLTDGWWRFTDRSLRPDYPLLDRTQWKTFLAGAGFVGAAAVPSADGTSGPLSMQSVIVAASPSQTLDRTGERWLIVGGEDGLADSLALNLRVEGADCEFVGHAGVRRDVERVQRTGRVDGVIHVAGGDATDAPADPIERQRRVTGTLLEIVRGLTSGSAAARLVVVTRGGQQVDSSEVIDVDAAAAWGMSRTIATEHPELRTLRIDLDPAADADEQSLAVLSELRAAAEEVAYRGGRRCISRMVRRSTPSTAARGVEHLRCTERGILDSLAYTPSERRAPGAGEVEIEVRAASLNFRDVVNALGLRSDSDRFGGECAGRIVAVGPGVTGCAIGDDVIALAPGSMGTRAIANAHLVVRKPASLSFEDAAGIPIVFITADYALNEVGNIGPGDSVLIHAAAGGVGLAAVQLARRAGARVIATAGTDHKRDYLRSLGIEHVFDSRSLSFAGDVMRATAGRGVTVVLNSLAGDFIPASIGVLAQGGRFLEIGKNSIWSAEQVGALRPDVRYFAIDLTPAMETAPETVAPALQRLVGDVASGALQRLPRRVFEAGRASDAFRLMAKGRHLGKVIVSQSASRASQPSSHGTCLITGGLSGLGLATASRLADRGCRSLMLMGRSAPTAAAAATIEALRALGVDIVVQQGDVSRFDDVADALSIVDTRMAPLTGVVHSAGVLDDGMLVQQEWSRFETVFGAKIAGAWHLHTLTQHRSLDFFVLFSSVAAIVGPRGQANHAAANAFLDALAHRRRAEGLPALSINWGVWSQIGAAVRHGVEDRVSGAGVGVIPPSDGLDVLESLMSSDTTQAAVLPIDWSRFGRSTADRVPQLFSRLANPAGQVQQKARAADKPAEDFVATLRETPAARRRKVVSAHVRHLASQVLGGGRAAQLDGRVALNEVGLDSLMAVELRNLLGASIGSTLPATLLFDHPTIDALTTYLIGLFVEPEPAAATPASPSTTGASAVLDQIDELSDEEIDRLLAARMAGAN